MRTTKLITISIMPEFLEEIEKLAKEERRTKSELVREALRRYIAEKELRRLQRYGLKKARELGLGEEDVQRLVDEYRAEKANV
ncbi:MAG: CopG family ribbon-helix-helix protein [Desulfobaccales bacterium]